MKRPISEWRESKDYLPDFLRDFHDQKDLFKCMHEMIDVEKNEYAKTVSWVAGQCYVIDIFLWFLSRYGYKIQRSSAKVEFENLNDAIRRCNEKHMSQLAATINEATK